MNKTMTTIVTVCELCFGTGEIVQGVYDKYGGDVDQIIKRCIVCRPIPEYEE